MFFCVTCVICVTTTSRLQSAQIDCLALEPPRKQLRGWSESRISIGLEFSLRIRNVGFVEGLSTISERYRWQASNYFCRMFATRPAVAVPALRPVADDPASGLRPMRAGPFDA
jgi:hypothetical protein